MAYRLEGKSNVQLNRHILIFGYAVCRRMPVALLVRKARQRKHGTVGQSSSRMVWSAGSYEKSRIYKERSMLAKHVLSRRRKQKIGLGKLGHDDCRSYQELVSCSGAILAFSLVL
jgi:hypothetical protein